MRTGEATLTIGLEMLNVGIARRFVGNALDGVVPREVVDDLMLATSELVTNAIEHGAGTSVVVTARTTADHATVSVRSHGVGPDGAPETWAVAPADQTSGRGLGIVRSVADEVDVVHVDGVVEVVVRRRLR